jgi:transposase InsO family protein
MVGPSARKAMAKAMVHEGQHSERKVCEVLEVPRSSFRYEPRIGVKDRELCERLAALAARHKRYGYRMVTQLLRREGLHVNRKRVHRLWKQCGLGLKRKRPKRTRYGSKDAARKKAQHINHVWTYDFVEDRTENGRRLKILCVVDEYSRQCLALHAAPRMTALDVQNTLQWLFLLHGRPGHLRSDNGPEFIAKSLQRWLSENGARTLYITPGSPWENAYIESFNDKLRSECLNMNIFKNGREAQMVLDAWRREYNEYRPHSSLNYLTPAEFAARCCNSSQPTASLRCSNGQEVAETMVIPQT